MLTAPRRCACCDADLPKDCRRSRRFCSDACRKHTARLRVGSAPNRAALWARDRALFA